MLGLRRQPHRPQLPAPAAEGLTEYEAYFSFDERHQGGPGLAHGGLVSAALDEACGLLATWYAFPAVTARMFVRFRRPVPINTELLLRARIDDARGRRITYDRRDRRRRPSRSRKRGSPSCTCRWSTSSRPPRGVPLPSAGAREDPPPRADAGRRRAARRQPGRSMPTLRTSRRSRRRGSAFASTRLRPSSTVATFLRYRLALFGVPVRWTTVIARWHPPRSFVDVQLSGPYLLWEHTHRLSASRAAPRSTTTCAIASRAAHSRRSSTASSGRCWRRSSTTAPDGQPSCCRRRRGDASGADRVRGSCRATRPARDRRWCARARCAPDRRRVRARSRSG